MTAGPCVPPPAASEASSSDSDDDDGDEAWKPPPAPAAPAPAAAVGLQLPLADDAVLSYGQQMLRINAANLTARPFFLAVGFHKVWTHTRRPADRPNEESRAEQTSKESGVQKTH